MARHRLVFVNAHDGTHRACGSWVPRLPCNLLVRHRLPSWDFLNNRYNFFSKYISLYHVEMVSKLVCEGKDLILMFSKVLRVAKARGKQLVYSVVLIKIVDIGRP